MVSIYLAYYSTELLEILRLLKSKSAGAILAQVKVDRAAKLTEELLATP